MTDTTGDQIPEPIPAGGQGELPPDGLTRSDIALVRHAFRAGWPVDDAIKADVVGRLAAIVRSELTPLSARDIIAAAKALIAADAANLAKEKIETPSAHLHLHKFDPTKLTDAELQAIRDS